MIEKLDGKVTTELVVDVICVIFSIVVLNVCYRNIVSGIFKIVLKMCE